MRRGRDRLLLTVYVHSVLFNTYVFIPLRFFNLPRLMMTINGSRAAVVAVGIIPAVVSIIIIIIIVCIRWVGRTNLDRIKKK